MSIERLRAFEPEEGYWLADSGGKDSTTLLDLAWKSGVKFEAHYNLTTVDPPEIVRFIKQWHPNTILDKPEFSMWENILREKMPPLRQQRWCCERLKERGGEGRRVLTGIRWEESPRRARRQVEDRQQSRKIIINPIIDWTSADVWAFIRREGLPYCSLYDEGFKRLGCIMCPQQGAAGMRRDAERWPKYAAAYIRTFDRLIALRRAEGKRCTWDTGQELFNWWVSGNQETAEGQECFVYS
jgi:phosphoadenosine phosphosulfate reductase